MQPTYFIPVFLLFFIILMMRRQSRLAIAKRIIKNKKTEDRSQMKELAKRFIDKECMIYAFDSNHVFDGVVKEVTDGAILIQKDDKIEAINLDFVIRIREYPTNKKGKKKSVVVD